MKRNKVLKIRLMEHEFDIVKEQSKRSALSMSDYARREILGASSMRELPDAQLAVDARANIKRIASNVNQGVKALHIANKEGRLDAEKMDDFLRRLEVVHDRIAAQSQIIGQHLLALGRD